MCADEVKLQIKGAILIKFQNNDRIESFRKGKLYAKQLSFYRDYEKKTGDNQVGDSFEAMFHINEGFLRVPSTGEQINLKDTLIPTIHSDDYVFCMFGIRPEGDSFSFDDVQKAKMQGFGNTALIVLDKDEFVRRIRTAAQKAGYECYFEAVNYYNPNEDSVNVIISMATNTKNVAFWKRKDYEYQHEARFLFTPVDARKSEDDHIIIDIGDISDITAVFPTDSVLNGIVSREG